MSDNELILDLRVPVDTSDEQISRLASELLFSDYVDIKHRYDVGYEVGDLELAVMKKYEEFTDEDN